MLVAAMRIFVTLVAVVLLSAVVVLTWVIARGPTEAEASEIAAVLAPTGAPDAPPAYAHCASCHLHDGSGRPDGSIPRLNGQSRAVLQNKLYRLRSGMLRLPVMDPFARTLEPREISEVAVYLSKLPDTPSGPSGPSDASDEARAIGASLYAEHCASCHGANGEGHDGLFASRLCGQYAGYMERRLREVKEKTRGDADAVMQGVLAGLPFEDFEPIVNWLAAGKGCVAP
jgi:cytochrome c553